MFEQGLPERFKEPKGWLWGEFTNARGGQLRFGGLSHHKTPLAHIVYVEGLSEFAEKTFELARDFNDRACNFSVFDRHGQGKYTRYLPDTHKQHSHGADYDVDDIIQYCKTFIPPGEPIVLLGHSTGALFALLALEKEPELFRGAVLTTPLLGFKHILLRNKEKFYARLPLPQIMTEKYIPGGKGWMARNHPSNSGKPEDFSSDPVRNKIHDYWPDKDPGLQTGSPTIGWVKEICKAVARINKPEFLKNIAHPLLVFTAEHDELVNNSRAFNAVRHMKNAQHYHLAESRHEPLMETDAIRQDALIKTYHFLKNEL